MSLTRLQRANLRFYLKFKDRPISLPGIIGFNRMLYLWLIGIFALVAFLLTLIAGSWAGLFVLSFLAGGLIRDLGFYRRTIHFWPIAKRIIHWETVEELVRDGEPKPKTEPGA
ncbi:MAG TPA: hypothetical protein VIS74_08195 [Chthoniobacterales bacterium]